MENEGEPGKSGTSELLSRRVEQPVWGSDGHESGRQASTVLHRLGIHSLADCPPG